MAEHGVGVDHVDADSVTGQLDGGDFAELVACGFAGAVGAELLAWAEDVLAGVDDDVPAESLSLEDTHALSHEQHVAPHVDVHDALEIVDLEVFDRTGVGDAGVGYDDVDAAVDATCLLETGADI